MKTLSQGALRYAFGLFSLVGALRVRAASPTVQLFTADSAVLGETIALRADVADSDGNLSAVIFYIAGPGISGWQSVGTVAVTGAQASAQKTWVPTQTGIFTARADVVDPTTGASAQRVLEVFAERKIVSSTTLPSGTGVLVMANGEIKTQENQTADSVVAASGSNLILWAAGRVVLKPGFRAQSGSFFWGTVDHNNNGYSDMEEATDTDGDGMFDAWEMEHGLNMLVNDANDDKDRDGRTNLAEFLAGTDPSSAANTPTFATFDKRDEDRDGIVNGIELLLGTDPSVPTSIVTTGQTPSLKIFTANR